MKRRLASSAPTSFGTATLFNVRFLHGFYNLDQGKCPDFVVTPSPESAALMAGLGLLYRDLGDGFVVTCPNSRLPALIGTIAAAGSPQSGYWTRLTFFLTLRNPGFVGITAMPIDIVPTQRNFYANNLTAVGRSKALLLTGAAGPGPDAFYPVTGPMVTVTTTADAAVSVSDISGSPVATADTEAGQGTVLSLAGRPYGLYGISASPASSYDGPASVAFVPSSPLTWGLIDLLLTQPRPGQGNAAAFPIASPTATTSSTVGLVLPFSPRKTVWRYFVVSQGGRGGFHPSLSVTGSGATFTQTKKPVILPTGETAIQFSSTTALPLQQHCRYRFKLSGQRRGAIGSRDDISIDRLPGAPAAPVWPASSGDPNSGSSEIFVYV